MGVKNRNADANNSIDKRNSSFESEKSNYKKKHDESIWGKHSAADESTNGNFSSIIVLLYIIN